MVCKAIVVIQYWQYYVGANLTIATISVVVSDSAYTYRTYRTHPTYTGCSGWVSAQYFLVSNNGDIYHNYAIEAPDQHVSSKLEYKVQRQLRMDTK